MNILHVKSVDRAQNVILTEDLERTVMGSANIPPVYIPVQVTVFVMISLSVHRLVYQKCICHVRPQITPNGWRKGTIYTSIFCVYIFVLCILYYNSKCQEFLFNYRHVLANSSPVDGSCTRVISVNFMLFNVCDFWCLKNFLSFVVVCISW